jgi:hypothetical protein
LISFIILSFFGKYKIDILLFEFIYILELADLVIFTFDSKKLTGFIMIEQCKSIDYKA